MEDDGIRAMKKKSKRPKLEPLEGDYIHDPPSSDGGGGGKATSSPVKKEEDDKEGAESLQEEEEALVFLIDHRAKEVELLRTRTAYYRSKLGEAEKVLDTLHSKLARLRSAKSNSQQSKTKAGTPTADSLTSVKLERKSPSPVRTSGPHLPTQPQSRPPLLIPALKAKFTAPAPDSKPRQAVKLEPPTTKEAPALGRRPNPSDSPSESDCTGGLKQRSSYKPTPDKEATGSQSASTARKKSVGVAASRVSKDLISSVRTRSSPSLVRVQSSTHISSHHNRKLRCLALSPANDQMFFTSALDGVVNLWQLQANGAAASLLSSTHSGTVKGRWPEDIIWHPDGDTLFAAYTADGGDSQVSIINFDASRDKRVTFLEGKPHVKGIINNIQFMPWTDSCFATGGSDHAVILWHEKDNEKSWKPEPVHRNIHSSAVNGVAGLQQKKIILSAGADKRIIGFDMQAGRADFKHQLESKCMSVLPNPFDFNMFMVQTGAPGKQLRLFDIRLRQTEIHSFGWKQESSESQSALINQAWSSDGFYISSGSVDPVIHIFDIRYNGHAPSQSVQAHQKRVFKAAWHRSLPLLVSISSDLNIGLHRIS